MSSTGIGVIGCGAISGIYLENLCKYDQTNVVFLADLDPARAKAKAEEHGVSKHGSVEDLLADPEVEIVLNLTIPAAHFAVSRACLEAGKHIYNEKPLAVERAEGQALLDLAESKGLRVGCAPDTVLGSGIQTCRELIDTGVLGDIVGLNGFMMGGGVESWHPNPPFYYQVGGGPLYDMGPYYLSAFIQLVGGVQTVTGMARVSFPVRHITSQPLAGTSVEVETPTHIVSVLGFQNGAIGQLTTSFDTMAGTDLRNIEVYGSEATLQVPDPNTFGGQPFIKKKGASDWEEVKLTRPYAENSRGLGLLDMALAIQEDRPHRASGHLAQHALDVMHAVHEAAAEGQTKTLTTGNVRPEPMPAQELGR